MSSEKKVLKFSDAQKQLLASLKLTFKEESFASFEKTFDSLVSHDLENKKLVLDQIFREFLTRHLLPPGNDQDVASCQRFIVQFAIQAARKTYCSPGTPILVLSDMFDILTLANCEILFQTVEQEVATWRESVFFTSCKNNLLRICNDLLRRLSRTQNTVFCGRILLFLAKFFPFSERSGLNVISEFNLDNTTNFMEKSDVKKEDDYTAGNEEVVKKVDTDADKLNLDVDYSLYSKFWQIQDYFRNPTQCYQKTPWKTFSIHAQDVLSTFQSFKLDPNSGRCTTNSSSQTEQYFAKYLTNQNLLQLQLSDSNFRRYILLQFLILFQYLKSNVKFKTDAQALESAQVKWIEETKSKIFKLLGETPPNGAEFSRSVKHILHREEHWNKWKNEGCPSFAKKIEETGVADKKPIGEGGTCRRKKRKLGDLIQKEVAEKKVNLGNQGLTSLWNLCPDNLEACRAKDRDFLPSLENYFEEAIEQLDPRNEVEEVYKKVNNGEWGWRALRLMSRRSSHFFISGNNPIAKLPDYLAQMLEKMAKDMPELGKPMEVTADSAENGDMTDDVGNDVGDSIPENVNDSSVDNGKVTDNQVVELAKRLSSHWKKLAPKLGITEDKMTEISGEEDGEAACLALLQAWVEMEADGATKEEIMYILEGLKLSTMVEGVF